MHINRLIPTAPQFLGRRIKRFVKSKIHKLFLKAKYLYAVTTDQQIYYDYYIDWDDRTNDCHISLESAQDAAEKQWSEIAFDDNHPKINGYIASVDVLYVGYVISDRFGELIILEQEDTLECEWYHGDLKEHGYPFSGF